MDLIPTRRGSIPRLTIMIIIISTSLLFLVPFRIMGCTWQQAVFQLVSIWAMLFLVYLTYIVLKA